MCHPNQEGLISLKKLQELFQQHASENAVRRFFLETKNKRWINRGTFVYMKNLFLNLDLSLTNVFEMMWYLTLAKFEYFHSVWKSSWNVSFEFFLPFLYLNFGAKNRQNSIVNFGFNLDFWNINVAKMRVFWVIFKLCVNISWGWHQTKDFFSFLTRIWTKSICPLAPNSESCKPLMIDSNSNVLEVRTSKPSPSTK